VFSQEGLTSPMASCTGSVRWREAFPLNEIPVLEVYNVYVIGRTTRGGDSGGQRPARKKGILLAKTMLSIEEALSNFSPERFVGETTERLQERLKEGRFAGAVFGASGGIDSLLTGTLCLKAARTGCPRPVVGLQMIDSRVKGENYNPHLYRGLGVKLIGIDITGEAIRVERDRRMPPHWLTTCLMKLTLRRTPLTVRRRLILAVKSGGAPGWALTHFERLILLHRLRIRLLREYARQRGLMLIICANRTEAALGYFVEGGIDDPLMGDFAPLASIYKVEVFRVARYLALPEEALRQKPSPGFGGIHDEEIVGPYDLADRVLVGLELGYSDAQIARALQPRVSEEKGGGALRQSRLYDIPYVRFLRSLVELNARKSGTEAE